MERCWRLGVGSWVASPRVARQQKRLPVTGRAAAERVRTASPSRAHRDPPPPPTSGAARFLPLPRLGFSVLSGLQLPGACDPAATRRRFAVPALGLHNRPRRGRCFLPTRLQLLATPCRACALSSSAWRQPRPGHAPPPRPQTHTNQRPRPRPPEPEPRPPPLPVSGQAGGRATRVQALYSVPTGPTPTLSPAALASAPCTGMPRGDRTAGGRAGGLRCGALYLCALAAGSAAGRLPGPKQGVEVGSPGRWKISSGLPGSPGLLPRRPCVFRTH